MGCDIHLYVEKAIGSRPDNYIWVTAEKFVKVYEDEPHNVPYEQQFYTRRNYNLFSILAGVRNYHGISLLSGRRRVSKRGDATAVACRTPRENPHRLLV